MKINIRHLELLEIFFHREKIEISEMKLLSNIQLKESLYLCAKCDTGSLQCLFSKNNYSQVKKLSLTQFVIGEEDVQVFKNSLNLENIKFSNLALEQIYISDLFCNGEDYNIKYIYFSNFCISESDLKFISKLKKTQKIIVNSLFSSIFN
ncbi:hypothetical protein CWI36_0815p0010 [Hamiltosporidium magnivora]|uniref:Uncharacterized protein n=1 Tax=Hamiltosporidium magnivora TaxID=148818 RepID=A0A4V2JVH2_9MICR|nr:hypothetical protein CWI36_0815p0010 [Hamiltosporidium magnivora]